MTIEEKYNVSNEEIKWLWNSTRVKEYYRQIIMYGKSNFELETNIEKAVFYCRYLKEETNGN